MRQNEPFLVWLGHRPIFFFIVILGMNLGISVAFTSGSVSLFADQIAEWLKRFLFGSVLVVSFVLALLTMILRGLGVVDRLNDERAALVSNAAISLIMTLIILILLVASPISNTPEDMFIPSSDVRLSAVETRVEEIGTALARLDEQLKRAGLTDGQIGDLSRFYIDNGQITLDDLVTLGLNQVQMEQIRNLLAAEGFLKEEDLYTIQTREAQNATIEAEYNTCYVEPLSGYPRVNVRRTPNVDNSNWMDYLPEGMKLRVIGHNGGVINQDLWWLVELPNRDQNDRFGWIASDVVQEINPAICVTLEKYPSE